MSATTFDLGLASVRPAAPTRGDTQRSEPDSPLRRAFPIWLGTSIAATAGYFFLSQGMQSILYDVIGMSAGLAMLLGARRASAAARPAWFLLALGVMTLSVGDIAYGVSQSGPSIADAFYVSGHVALATGLILLIRVSIPARQRHALIDTTIIAAVGLVASLVFVDTSPSINAGLPEQAVSMAYPLMDLVLLGLTARLALSHRSRGSASSLLVGAVVLLLLADIGYFLQGYGTAYSLGSELDAAWLLSYVLFGAVLFAPRAWRSGGHTVAPSRSGPPDLYLSVGGASAWHALRVRRVLGLGGVISMTVGAVTLFTGMAWQTPEMVFVASVYGITGTLMLFAGAVQARA